MGRWWCEGGDGACGVRVVMGRGGRVGRGGAGWVGMGRGGALSSQQRAPQSEQSEPKAQPYGVSIHLGKNAMSLQEPDEGRGGEGRGGEGRGDEGRGGQGRGGGYTIFRQLDA